jgi:hypothetical protein
MSRHILYAYVCGKDLNDIADDLLVAFDDFVADREWVCEDPHVVNQRRVADNGDWDLGLNVTLPDPGREAPGWFSDVTAIAKLLSMLSTKFGSEFAIGISDTKTGLSEDLHYITSADPDMNRLRAVIGVGAVE